jgi:hypothetical protein
MTTAEAHIRLGNLASEDLHECVENALFQAKQELIQKADQILLFPAKEKKWRALQLAAETLGYTFRPESNITISELDHSTLENAFQSFHHQRSRLLKSLNNVHSFEGLCSIQHALFSNFQSWLLFWENMKLEQDISTVKLSAQIDSMVFLQWILSLKESGIMHKEQIDDSSIPVEITQELLRFKALLQKIS